MKDFAYGAYNDLVIELSHVLVAAAPDKKQKIEAIIFREAMYKWAQTFLTARSEKEISKEKMTLSNESILSEKELKAVSQASPGIIEQIKASLFPNEQAITSHLAATFKDFSARLLQRLEDYNHYWHPFYDLQQRETKNQMKEINSSTFFDPKANPQLSAEIMKKVWRQFVVPEINKKIEGLKQTGQRTSDARITMAECLTKHMAFIDYLVENASQYISSTQKQLNVTSHANAENKYK